MILYHGTNIDFNVINLDKCLPFTDFGKGFYLTDIREQAEALAQKKSRLFGGSPIVQEYIFIPDEAKKAGLKTLLFDMPSREWADFIFRNLNNQYYFGSHKAIELLKRI